MTSGLLVQTGDKRELIFWESRKTLAGVKEGRGESKELVTNQGRVRYCRIYSAPQAPCRPFRRAVEQRIAAFWSATLARKSSSTDSRGTNPPIGRELQHSTQQSWLGLHLSQGGERHGLGGSRAGKAYRGYKEGLPRVSGERMKQRKGVVLRPIF